MTNAKVIIKDYQSLKAEGRDTWLRDCYKTRDILSVIEMAALARDLKKDKHPHQHRIPNAILRKFADRLIKNSDQIVVCETFTQLYESINSFKVDGIGRLTVYDTTHRIGSRLRLKPDMVYMHQGTKVGTERYLGKKVKTKAVSKSEFKDFKHLSCEAIEDIMCIYKDEFLHGGKTHLKRTRC